MSSINSLTELVRIVSNALPERTQYVTRSSIERGELYFSRLFKSLNSGKFESEKDLSFSVFGVAPSDSRYRTHKSQFKTVLLNSLFVLDVNRGGYSKTTRIEFESDRRAFMARVLLSFGARQLAKELASDALKTAMECELWHNAMRFSTILRDSAAYEGEEELRREYAHQYLQFAAIELAQQSALNDYGEIVCTFAKLGAENTEIESFVRTSVKKVDRAFLKYKTFGLALSRFRLRCAMFQISRDYVRTLRECSSFERELSSQFKSFASVDRKIEIMFKSLVCHIQLRSYNVGKQTTEKLNELLIPGSNHWFNCREYEFMLCMHSGEFLNAQSVVDDVRNNIRFTLQPKHRLERWRIYALYVEYCLGKIPKLKTIAQLKKYLPIHTKDKAGFNASILILQILVLIHRKDFRGVIDRMEALQKYRLRHLSDKVNVQLNAFFRMLSILVLSSFEPKLARAKAEKLSRILMKSTGDALDGIQILPYDVIWEHILSSLARR